MSDFCSSGLSGSVVCCMFIQGSPMSFVVKRSGSVSWFFMGSDALVFLCVVRMRLMSGAMSGTPCVDMSRVRSRSSWSCVVSVIARRVMVCCPVIVQSLSVVVMVMGCVVCAGKMMSAGSMVVSFVRCNIERW